MGEYISKEYLIAKFKKLANDYTGEKRQRGLAYATAADMVALLPSADVQPVRHGQWITKAEDYYKAWLNSGRSWVDMPYLVTGLKFACSECFEQYDVNAEGVEKWNGCPLCLARMDGDSK